MALIKGRFPNGQSFVESGQFGLVVNLTCAFVFILAAAKTFEAASTTSRLSSVFLEAYSYSGLSGVGLLAEISSFETKILNVSALLIGAQAVAFGSMCERFWNEQRGKGAAHILSVAWASTAIGLMSIAVCFYGLLVFHVYQSACNTLLSPCTIVPMSNLNVGLLAFSPFAGLANVLFGSIAGREVNARQWGHGEPERGNISSRPAV